MERNDDRKGCDGEESQLSLEAPLTRAYTIRIDGMEGRLVKNATDFSVRGEKPARRKDAPGHIIVQGNPVCRGIKLRSERRRKKADEVLSTMILPKLAGVHEHSAINSTKVAIVRPQLKCTDDLISQRTSREPHSKLHIYDDCPGKGSGQRDVVTAKKNTDYPRNRYEIPRNRFLCLSLDADALVDLSHYMRHSQVTPAPYLVDVVNRKSLGRADTKVILPLTTSKPVVTRELRQFAKHKKFGQGIRFLTNELAGLSFLEHAYSRFMA
ncbi:hypothetical protein COOONC_20865 [Cooperia oncophora]